MDGISGKQGNGEAYGTVMSHGVAFGGRMRGIGTGAGHIEKTLRIRKGIKIKTADESCEVCLGFDDCVDVCGCDVEEEEEEDCVTIRLKGIQRTSCCPYRNWSLRRRRCCRCRSNKSCRRSHCRCSEYWRGWK